MRPSVGGDQNLIFEQPHQVRRERPRLDEFFLLPLVLRRGNVGQAKVLGRVGLADQYERAALVGADRLDGFEQIARRVGDLQKIRGRDLRRARVVGVSQLDRRPFQEAILEFLTQSEPEHAECASSDWVSISLSCVI